VTELALLGPVLALLAAAAMPITRAPSQADRLNIGAAFAVAAAALAAAVGPDLDTRWLLIDGANRVFIAVIAVVGLCSALVSPAHLRTSGRSWFTATRSRHAYYAAFYVFWSALLAVPIAANIAVVWLIVEATTAASALLVAFSGRREALEAGWKYLVLTTLGLSVALLGIVVLAIGQARIGNTGLHALTWRELEAAVLPHEATLVAFVLLIAGLATKIGWAPVHNWLPDAHSEAPAPLSAALLPTIALVAWRAKDALEDAVGPATAGALFIGFGLASMLVAVPFLWRTLPWKRLLAYSSLEHMGVIALGIGLGTELALAGVVLHVAGHALAKSLGFYAPHPAAKAVALVALAGLPPSPLFVSELLIVLGGIDAGETAVVAVAVIALALGFLGLLHALLEDVMQERSKRRRRPRMALSGALTVGLLALTAVSPLVPGSGLV
jgi:hydrogenase-4 component F